MSDFFKSWRRWIGIVLLMCDCVLTTMWIASRSFDVGGFVFVTPRFALAAAVMHEYLVLGFLTVDESTEEPWGYSIEGADPHETFQEAAGDAVPPIVWLTRYELIGAMNGPCPSINRMCGMVLSLPLLLIIFFPVTAWLLFRPGRSRLSIQSAPPTADPPAST